MTFGEAVYGAVEGGGRSFLVGVARGPNDWLARDEISTGEPEPTLAAVGDFFERHRQLGVRRIGVASFGPLDLARGTTHITPKPGWSRVPLVSRLRSRLGLPISLDTDVNAAAIAEARWGAAQGEDPVVYITVGTGIGVGVLVHGRPLHGLLHPELGHLPAPALENFKGVCPFHGRCIEGVAGAPALRARLGMDPADAPDESPVWQREGEYLGHLITAAVLALSPKRIVVGGGIAQRQALWPSMHATVCQLMGDYLPMHELSPAGIERYVVQSELSPDAGLLGALALAMDEGEP